MDGLTDALVFGFIVLARFLVPLFIFRFPLPAAVAALLVDAADETMFDYFTNLSLENYQLYDKALDVYFLALAYIATLRNWANLYAYRVGRFLWYFRLAGTTLFELTGLRFLLLIFPNTFEYFFIWYEAIRTRWNPARLTTTAIIGAAALIWVGIKLPQEFWIHVLELDFTDFLKEEVLGASPETGWGRVLRDNLWVFAVLLGTSVAVAFFLRWLEKRLPEPDWALSFDSNRNVDPFPSPAFPSRAERHWREGLVEKVVLVSLIVINFSPMLPNVEMPVTEVFIGVSVIIAANAFISHWLATRGTYWRSIVTEFAGLTAINLVIAVAWVQLLLGRGGLNSYGALLFFNFMLTLIVVLYDRYRPIYDLRVRAGAEPVANEAGGEVERAAGA